ncbi:hypothetical protein PSUB009319_32150 [Ralstonia sp. SET104]|nr:hypothetical protein PSUB009319_32150 [Ralstonia sp. SET104]
MKKRFTEEQIIGFLKEAENAKLKKLLAEAMLDMEALKVVVKGKP